MVATSPWSYFTGRSPHPLQHVGLVGAWPRIGAWVGPGPWSASFWLRPVSAGSLPTTSGIGDIGVGALGAIFGLSVFG